MEMSASAIGLPDFSAFALSFDDLETPAHTPSVPSTPCKYTEVESVPSGLSPASLGPSPFPSTFSSPSAASCADANLDFFHTSGDISRSTAGSSDFFSTPIKSSASAIAAVSVPHFSKGPNKQWLFACRVVPIPRPDEPAPRRARESLGQMSLAGDQEPHTVWRSWQEFADFAASLLVAFPDDRRIAGSARLASPVPRLSSKAMFFTTRSSLVRRQEELEAFCQQLFRLPPDVCESELVRNFFQVRLEDHGGILSLRDANIVRPSLPTFATSFDTRDLKSPAESSSCRSFRPALTLKMSTPNLRVAASGDPTSPLPIKQRDESAHSALPSSSEPLRGPAGTAHAPTRSAEGANSFGKTLRKKASGGLRSIRSLGDLRGAARKPQQIPSTREPVPALPTAFAATAAPLMERAQTQPVLAPSARLLATSGAVRAQPPASLAMGSMGSVSSAPGSAPLPLQHRRTGSVKSTASSIEDLWGAPFPTFRQTPSGRVEYMRPEEIARTIDSRRQSASFIAQLPQRTASTGSLGHQRVNRHRSSASTSSIESTRSSGSSASSMARSLSRSSAGSDCITPPTPPAEWTASPAPAANRCEQEPVPPLPFFPVPPSMQQPRTSDQVTPRSSTSSFANMSYGHGLSHDKVPVTPRSRAASSASACSRRRSSRGGPTVLETIQSSPTQPPPSTSSEPLPWTFKVLHQDENIVLRVPSLSTSEATPELSELRPAIRRKFAECRIALPEDGGDAEWGLAWQVPGGTIRLVVEQADLEACLADSLRRKVVLKVIC